LQATPIEYGIRYNGTVYGYQWNYYSFTIGSDMAQFYITSSKTSNQGDPEFFLGQGYYPTGTNYGGRVDYWGGGIGVRAPTIGSTYYFGIYGGSTQSADYIFEVDASCGPCLNGVCQEYVCICSKCYQGLACQNLIPGCNPQPSYVVGIVVAVVIIVGAVIIIGLVVTFGCMKDKQLFKKLNKTIELKKRPYREFEEESRVEE